jgi:hypothetical protein
MKRGEKKSQDVYDEVMRGEISAEDAIKSLTKNDTTVFTHLTNRQAIKLIENADIDLSFTNFVFYGADPLVSDKITEIGSIFADNTKEIGFPNLRKSGNIYANRAEKLNFPGLRISYDISANRTEKLNFPNLRKSGHIYAGNAKKLSLPKLNVSGAVFADKDAVIYGRPGLRMRNEEKQRKPRPHCRLRMRG